ncbi:hypothetical protein SSP24_19990 [Streptomyces spinoverrucosus]|uniref:Uncharacterized protein n=1 Tax=Streptomyces spinoverrucosus TaxID=284043 RepID=A0A4Y3VBT8_9ACTN|nr:hypothetical protein SSP24_19990 [Streptomyces spinoverrucosus]GHB47895.1 hypothetical protein GCM10010397_17450 [Streptomyces spinoverrucosus]
MDGGEESGREEEGGHGCEEAAGCAGRGRGKGGLRVRGEGIGQYRLGRQDDHRAPFDNRSTTVLVDRR